jgi:hypothetical protein
MAVRRRWVSACATASAICASNGSLTSPALPLALVVVEGDLRGGLGPAGQGLVEKANYSAVLIGGQDLEAPQGLAAPGPVADGLKAPRNLVIRVATPTVAARLQWGCRLVVDVLTALDAHADCVHHHLREALHLAKPVVSKLGRELRRIAERIARSGEKPLTRRELEPRKRQSNRLSMRLPEKKIPPAARSKDDVWWYTQPDLELQSDSG